MEGRERCESGGRIERGVVEISDEFDLRRIGFSHDFWYSFAIRNMNGEVAYLRGSFQVLYLICIPFLLVLTLQIIRRERERIDSRVKR